MPDTPKDSASKITALGRANRTEAVQLRVEPRRRFVLEMVARRHNRSLASLLEEVTDEWLTRTQPTVVRDAERAWSPIVAERFVKQAQTFPDTLTDAEAVLYFLIKQDHRYWFGSDAKPRPKATDATCDFALIDREWEELCARTINNRQAQEFNEQLRSNLKAGD